MITPLVPPPSANEIMMTNTRCGRAMVRSISTPMTISSFLFSAESTPSAMAMRVAPMEANMPTRMLTAKPLMVRVNMSRPSVSVPKIC